LNHQISQSTASIFRQVRKENSEKIQQPFRKKARQVCAEKSDSEALRTETAMQNQQTLSMPSTTLVKSAHNHFC